MVRFAWTAALSFSALPLRLSLTMGFVVFALGASQALNAVIRVSLGLSVVPGWSSTIVAMCLVGGAILMSLGILGEYVGRIFEELKGRRLYVIDYTVNLPLRSAPSSCVLSYGRLAVKGMHDRPATSALHRETDFHNEWARGADLSRIDVRAAFESPAAVENQFILEILGPIAGKRVLDVGSGLGESSVYFALLGADVTCVDVSEEMIGTAVRLAALHSVRIQGVVCPAEDPRVEPESFKHCVCGERPAPFQ